MKNVTMQIKKWYLIKKKILLERSNNLKKIFNVSCEGKMFQ